MSHVQQVIEHFVHAWTALVDGALSCDWDMLDDESSNLAVLLNELNRAWAIPLVIGGPMTVRAPKSLAS